MNDAHYPLAMASFEAGKAALCEKLIANAMGEAEERTGNRF